MLVAAAVCPHPPLLIPQAMGSAGWPETAHATAGESDPARSGAGAATSQEARVDAQIRQLRAACYAAVRDLAAAVPDLVIVIGGGNVSRRYPGSAAGSLRELGIPFSTGTGEPVLPLSLTVGSWLVRHCLGQAASTGILRPAHPGRLELQEVAQSWSASECAALGERLVSEAPRVALLVMGDGSARKALGMPGAADPPAERYDAQLADALAAGDVRALAGLDPGVADHFLVAGRAAWQVLAGAAAGHRIRGQLRYAAAPLDVSYFVASWLPE